jgi:dihydrofolate synthase/folylpolyglutamate synthase
MLGETREEIAREKLAVVQPGEVVVLGEPEWEDAAREAGAGRVVVTGRSNLAVASAAAQELLGRPVDPHAADEVRLPGRLERRGEAPLEIWDGAHNLSGVGWLLARVPSRDWTLVVSILAEKNADDMLAALSALGRRLVATASSNARALPAAELARLAERHFRIVECVPDPAAALERGRELARPDGALLVTGSLYLLADLSQVGRRRSIGVESVR